MRSSRVTFTLRVAVIASIAALAVVLPRRELRLARRRHSVDLAGATDARLTPLRHRIPEGARVAYLVPSGTPDEEMAAAYRAQYALSPAIVLPVKLGHCLPDCDLSHPDFVIADPPGPEIERVLSGHHDFVALERTPTTLLLGRVQP